MSYYENKKRPKSIFIYFIIKKTLIVSERVTVDLNGKRKSVGLKCGVLVMS